MEFKADKITIRGPKADNGYVVSFDVGEYQQMNVVKLLAIPQHTALNIRVEPDD